MPIKNLHVFACVSSHFLEGGLIAAKWWELLRGRGLKLSSDLIDSLDRMGSRKCISGCLPCAKSLDWDMDIGGAAIVGRVTESEQHQMLS